MEPFPPIEPYEHGLLDVGDGNRVYWDTCGNPTASRRSSSTAARLRMRRREPPLGSETMRELALRAAARFG